MTNFQYPYSNRQSMYTAAGTSMTNQPYYPTPQGAIYFINNVQDLNNIPMSNGISAFMCLCDDKIYLRSMQNGVPSVIEYTMYTEPVPTNEKDSDLSKRLAAIEARLVQLEKPEPIKKGGSLDGLL